MIAYFARHPNAANLLMLSIMALGLATVPTMKRETLPELQSDLVQISVIYRGATAEEVEDAVCRRLEDAIQSVTNLDEMRCEAGEGAGIMTAVMHEDATMVRFLDDIKSEVDAIDDFPDGTETPVVTEFGRTEDVISIAIRGIPQATELKAYAEDVKARLLRLDAIEDIHINGFSDRHIRVEATAHRLRQHGLSVADLANTIKSQSIGTPSGKLEGDDEDIILRFDDQRKAVGAFADIPIVSSPAGAQITLGEIATVHDVFDLVEEKVEVDGQRAALLDVRKTRSQDALLVLDAVRDFVETEQQRLPPGIKLSLTRDRASVVQDRIDLLLRNGLQGLALVFLTLWLFFSLRYSFWVVMGLPVSFLGGLFLLHHMDVSLNMISMVGLLIGVGLLMDDAIVIAENIAVRLQKGEQPVEAASAGASEVLPGILSSFATTVLVFGALAFISGTMGQILRVLPIVLIVVLAISLIEAFLILPHHLSHSLAHINRRAPVRFRLAFERLFEGLRDRAFGSLLRLSLRFRYFTLGTVIMLLMVTLALPASGILGFRGFPDVQGDVLEARILLPQGTPLRRTEAIVEHVSSALWELNEEFKPLQPQQQDLVKQVAVLYGENPDAFEKGPHVVRISVDLLGAEQRNADLDEVRARWRELAGSVADVIRLSYTEPAIGPAGRAIDIRLKGEDLDRIKSAAEELQAWFAGFSGVYDLGDDLRPGKREYRLQLKSGAGALGLDAREISDQIRGAYQGIRIDEFPVGAETYEVNVRLAAGDRDTPADFDALMIIGTAGELIPLEAVTDVREVRGWARIYRVDRMRTVTVQGDVDTTLVNAQALVSNALADFVPGLRERYPDVIIDVQGETKESADTGASIARNAFLGILGVYALLAFQFRNYGTPLVVMCVIPTILIGVFWGHLVVGIDLSMPSIVGMTSLGGVVVNNSILLMQFTYAARARGLSAEDAAYQAGINRFRPILLTTLTTVAGLLPLLTEKSLQAQVLIPLATSLAFGLAATTFIALFLVPALYCIIEDFRAAPAALDTPIPDQQL